MNEDTALARYGLWPSEDVLPQIRARLEAETQKERREQGAGDTALMKLFCVQLFLAGHVEDAALVWSAKAASFDSYCSIDADLVCVSGFEDASAFFRNQGSPEALRAHDRLSEYIESDGLTFESPSDVATHYARYYGVDPG